MYISNRLYDHLSTEDPSFSAAEGDFYNMDGIKVYYACKGSGSPVLMLHALHPAASSIEWNNIIDELSANHTVYMLDLPGCGRSDKSRLHYSNFFYVKLIDSFMRDMSLRGIPVVASNLTSSVAVMAAGYNPQLFSKIILISPPSITALKEMPDSICKLKKEVLSLPIVGTFIYNIMASKSQIDLAFTEKYFYNPFHDNDDLVNLYFTSAHYGEGKGHYFAAYLLGRYININIAHTLPGITVPIKIIEGAECSDSVQVITEWSSLKPEISIAEVIHTRQLPHLEEPEITVREILSFIDESKAES